MSAPGTCLTTDERSQVMGLLRDSEKEFLELTSGLTDAQWTWRSAPDRWSVQQTAEHMVLGEQAMLGKVMEALAAPPQPDWKEQEARKTTFLGRVLPDRRRKAGAPPPLAPHHDWTPAETVARYRAARARTRQFVEEVEGPMKDHLAEHPFPVFNMLNAYQWLLYIPLHNARHNQQIAETLKEMIR